MSVSLGRGRFVGVGALALACLISFAAASQPRVDGPGPRPQLTDAFVSSVPQQSHAKCVEWLLPRLPDFQEVVLRVSSFPFPGDRAQEFAQLTRAIQRVFTRCGANQEEFLAMPQATRAQPESSGPLHAAQPLAPIFIVQLQQAASDVIERAERAQGASATQQLAAFKGFLGRWFTTGRQMPPAASGVSK
jgi:hypothetical protein